MALQTYQLSCCGTLDTQWLADLFQDFHRHQANIRQIEFLENFAEPSRFRLQLAFDLPNPDEAFLTQLKNRAGNTLHLGTPEG